MIAVLSREQMRAFDQHAITKCKVPSVVLMENAGRNAAEVVEGVLALGSRVAVVCGPGNNGGDGFVVARHLAASGNDVTVYLLAEARKLSGDALLNHDAWLGLGGAVTYLPTEDLSALELGDVDVIVDGIFGTGLDRDVGGRQRIAIERINAAGVPVVALDIPSGLHANTGAVLGVAVDADVTVTFAHPKLGLLTSAGAAHAGEVHVVDIGVPAELLHDHGAEIVEASDVAALLEPRPIDAHKVSVGHVFAVAGSAGKTGAALLVARGALRAGAGLATVCTFPDAADSIDLRALEEMTARIDPNALESSLDEILSRAGAIAIGPGLGLDERARRVVDHVVLGWDGPKVVDADAISHFAGRAAERARAKGSLVLTPHPGELGRLLGIESKDVEADRFAAVARAVELTGAVVLLKGPRTLIAAPGEFPVVNVSGAPALATGGAGDVLTGIIAALCSTLAPRWAAIAGAYVHGASAEEWCERVGADRGLVAHEIADGVPAVLAKLRSE